MLIKHGIPVSPGTVIGQALVLGAEDFRIPHRFVSVAAVDTEVERLRSAISNASDEISAHADLATEKLGEQYGAILQAHLHMARDQKLMGEIEQLIRKYHYCPEFATSQVLHRYARELQSVGDSYLAERAHDIYDLEKRLLRHLLGERREELAHLTVPVLVLAHNLTPSETAALNKKFVHGFATEVGGRTSHTAILAGALEIPAVVGVGSFLRDVSGGETVIIDGDDGQVIVNPDEATLQHYQQVEDVARRHAERLQSLRTLRAETADGVRISLMGNIEFPEEAEHCRELGADGIGLYRTEFLYLEHGRERSEEDHYEAYLKVVSSFPDRPVVIRTLDLGADKVAPSLVAIHGKSGNPELGLRSIRLSLENQPLFKTQLRAALRAAVHGDLRIMFPLISSLMELRQARMILADVMEDLEEAQVPFERDVPVGIMVEVPAVVLQIEDFAQEADFLSVGTNDLIQYTLAVDRSDPAVAKYYASADPSILKMLSMVIDAGRKYDVPVTVCGQMSSDPKFLPVLVGLGLRQLSVTPHAIPELKEIIRNLTLPEAERIAQHVRTLEVARDIESYLRGELRKFSPGAK